MKSFPKDCGKCENFIRQDMSVDDYICICKVNSMMIDECDSYFMQYKCPLEEKK